VDELLGRHAQTRQGALRAGRPSRRCPVHEPLVCVALTEWTAPLPHRTTGPGAPPHSSPLRRRSSPRHGHGRGAATR
jgi:hypothetical protein